MQDYRTLKLLDRFECVFYSFGVDYKVMKKHLQVKLTMDGRRMPTILKKALPFSESFDEYNQNGNSAIIFGLMLFVALLAGLHFASTFLPYGIYLYLGICSIGLVISWRLAFNVTWEQIIKG